MNSQNSKIHPLVTKFAQEVKPKLGEEFAISNLMAIPKIKKIILNVGVGEAVTNKKAIEIVARELATITGQKPIITRAHRSIASFKIAAGDAIGLKVTLRGRRMYDFLQKLTTIVLPRVRDFRGLSTQGFDGRGNYSLGFREQIVFPEIDYGKIDKGRGIQVTIVTSAKTNEQAKKLLELMGLPFKH